MLFIILSWTPIQVYPQKLEEKMICLHQSPTISPETMAKIYGNNVSSKSLRGVLKLRETKGEWVIKSVTRKEASMLLCDLKQKLW